MSDEQVQTFDEAVNAFYPDAEAEPLEAPTDEAAEDETPVEDEANSNYEAEDDTDEEASEDDQDDSEDDSDNLVYEINGKDYTAKDIELLESGTLMQADYTKKTQALADDRKEMDSNVVILSDAITKTNDLSAQLEVLVGEDKAIDWDELEVNDPDEYIRLQKRAQTREKALTDIKANNQVNTQSNVNVEAERVKLIEANPQWVKDDKPTQAYKDDMNGLEEFYKVGEWTQDQVDFINGNAKIAQLVLESVRRNSDDKTTTEKKASAKRKIIATPKSGKVKASTQQLSAEEIFYGK